MDYAADIPLFGMPEFLGTGANMLGMAVAWVIFKGSNSDHFSARRCFQWMIFYFLMHAAIHMSWGYKFRVPFTVAMNIAFAWIDTTGFV